MEANLEAKLINLIAQIQQYINNSISFPEIIYLGCHGIN